MPKQITLTQPHEHAGRVYPVGATLTLDDDQADWLIGLKRAEEAAPKAAAEPAPAQAPAKPVKPGK